MHEHCKTTVFNICNKTPFNMTSPEVVEHKGLETPSTKGVIEKQGGECSIAVIQEKTSDNVSFFITWKLGNHICLIKINEIYVAVIKVERNIFAKLIDIELEN